MSEKCSVKQRLTNMPWLVVCAVLLLVLIFFAICMIASIENGIVRIFVFFLLFLATVLVTDIIIRWNLMRPIRRLIADMEHIRESGWQKKLDGDFPNREIGMLSEQYNATIAHINALHHQIAENEKAAHRAEMQVRYEQIKPHFLYNALEVISYMALSQGAEDVYTALETLGSFYRGVLSGGDCVISLKRELHIIQDYLTLQRLRYGNLFRVEYDVDEATLPYMLPKLVLQPLVENCIQHGIKPKGDNGIISISTCLKGNKIMVTVRDNGVGMSGEEIRHCLGSEATHRHGFGLCASLDRLRHFCGEDDVVTIRSELGEYTEIAMRIPTIREEKIQDVSSDAD